MNRLIRIWTELRASLWFVPGLMIACSIALAFGLVELDASAGREWLMEYPLIFGVGTDGSRGMLTAIASSMLTVATLAFSLTLNAVTQASNQFTPRIFRNFLRDRANQFVLGYFVSVFAYCLIVLRTIRSKDDDGSGFVPSIAVVTGLVLALGGIFVLIFFIHHIAASLRINQIIDGIVDETKRAVESLFPSKLGKAAEEDIETAAEGDDEGEWTAVPSLQHGYLQRVDQNGLLEFADEHAAVLRVDVCIGEFIGTGAVLVSIRNRDGGSGETPPDQATIEDLNALFSIERQRSIDQDAGFGIRQLVDIALKALSPGVNDTTTAVTCVEYLGEIVADLADRKFPERVRRSEKGSEILVSAPQFADLAASAFDQIRVSGRGDAAVLGCLARSISFAASRARSPERRQVLAEQLQVTRAEAKRTLETAYEYRRFVEGGSGGRTAVEDNEARGQNQAEG